MSEKLVKIGLKRMQGFLYFIDKQGNVGKTPKAYGKKGSKGTEVVYRSGIKKEPGYLYFLDKDGDLSRAKMMRRKKIAA